MEIKILENNNIKEKLLYKKTKEGLDIYFMPKEGYSKKFAIFATKYGSIDNKFIPRGEESPIVVPEGIAHFLEHKLFEEPGENIFDKFSRTGAYVNAYTNFNQTAYLFYSTENFYENLELLVGFVQNPHFTDENVEKEKGIIGQEINMYQDNPGWKVFFNCLRGMYFNHPVKEDIAGTVDSIQRIDKELLYQCYNTFYNPENMVLFVVGDLSFDDIIQVVEKTEKPLGEELVKVERDYPEEPAMIKEEFIEESMMTSNPLFYIGVKDNDLGLKAEMDIRKDIITNLLLDMLFGSSSDFYNRTYEEGLIDTSFGSYFTGKETYGHSLITGESKNPREVYNRIKSLFNTPADELLNISDFERIKRKSLGGYLMGFNSLDFIVNNFIDLYFNGILIIDYIEIMESIKYEEVVERFKNHFKEENMVLSIINPLN